jgi:hypothetical protein
MATSASTIIAAAVAKARREVRQHFEDSDAFDAARAVTYDPPDGMHRRQFKRLVDRNIVRKDETGRYWIDRVALRREQERQKAAVWMALAIIAIFLLSATGIILLVTR